MTPSVPPPEGKDHRIREIRDPQSPVKAANGSTVAVSGAVVVAVDTYDETGDGKSAGTIYVADLGSQEAYSGISLYSPSFIPGNLRVGAGDALDLRGVYQENQTVPIAFAPGNFLIQLANPIATFRFDAQVPAPVEVKDINDLADYAKGSKWLNMIVTVKNVTIGKSKASKGRSSWGLPATDDSKCTDAVAKPPVLVNELTDLTPIADKLAEGTVVKSITGVVTFFCNLHIAPRDVKDIVF